MESIAVALLIILLLVGMEVLSRAKTTLSKKSKAKLPPLDIDHKQNELTMFKWRKAEYLSSKEWRLKRIQVKERDNYACQLCGTTEDLHVHHMSGYDQIPNEPIDCLITLCNVCHKAEHDKVGYPKTYSDYMKFNHPIKTK